MQVRRRALATQGSRSVHLRLRSEGWLGAPVPSTSPESCYPRTLAPPQGRAMHLSARQRRWVGGGAA
jgi:hypothetical protein